MEQNDEQKIILKNSILELFGSLNNSYVENPNLIESQLVYIYTNQSINVISILFDIFTQHPNINFRKQASFGISFCIKKCFSMLDTDSIQKIFNQFFQIMALEPDDNLLSFIVRSAVTLFIQARIQNKIGFEDFGILNFFQSLAESDFCRCIKILKEFLPESVQYEKKFYDFIICIFNHSFQIQQKDSIVTEIIFIGSLLLNKEEVDDKTKNEIMIRFSQLFIELLNSIDELKIQTILCFNRILSLDIQPFKMDIIFEPSFQVIQNQNINIMLRYNIAFLLSLSMSLDNSKISIEHLISLFHQSINISIIVFDISPDQSDPDSVVMDLLMSECLRRIPDQQVQSIVIQTLQCLIGQSEAFIFSSGSLFAKLYTALMLIDVAIKRSDYIFMNDIPQMIDICILCLNADHLTVQNMASNLFCNHGSLFTGHILPKILDFVNMILSKIAINGFRSGFALLHLILYEIPYDINDQLFLPIYNMCTKKLNELDDTHLNDDAFELWILLGDLFRNVSEEVGSSRFDEIFPICAENLNTFYQTQLQRQAQNMPLLDDNSNQTAIAELIGSFAFSCGSKLQPYFENTTTLLLNLLQFQVQSYFQGFAKDLSICNSILNCLKFFVNYTPKLITPFIGQIIPLIIQYCSLRIDKSDANNAPLIDEKYETRDMILSKIQDFSNLFKSPSVNLILAIFTEMPEYFQTKEIISELFTISISLLDSFSQEELLSAIHLLIQLVKFIYGISQMPNNQGDNNIYELVKLIIPYIISLIKNEISSDDHKVLSSCLCLINTIYVHFGFDIFFVENDDKQQVNLLIELMNILLDLTESEYQDNGSLHYIKDLYDNIREAFEIVIKHYSLPDFSFFVPFVPRIFRFLNENNIYFQVFSIDILSCLVQKSSIIDTNILVQIFNRSIRSISDDDPTFSIHFVFFLSSLRFNYPKLLIDNQDKLIPIIDKAISTINSSDRKSRSLIEYLLALFASVDQCLGEENNSLISQERFNWFVSFLPIQNSQEKNNQIIFVYLLSHYNQFPEMSEKILSLLCQVFVSMNTIKESHLSYAVIDFLYKLIASSKIIENHELISHLFNENQAAAQSFIMTIQKLMNLASNQ